MGRRNGAGTSLVAALLVVGVVGWVLSQVWVYLVVGGALGLMGWIGWVVSRNLKAAPSSARLIAVDAPRSAPAPKQHFRVLSQVDPRVFDDPVLAEAAALKTFA